MKPTKNAQSAVEYLIILAMALGIILPTTYLFFQYSSKSSIEIMDAQITQVGSMIVDTAQTVFYSGEGSKIVLDVKMPDNIRDINIKAGRELVFSINSEAGNNEMIFFSPQGIPLTSADTSDGCKTSGNCKLSDIISASKIKIESVSGGSKVIITILN